MLQSISQPTQSVNRPRDMVRSLAKNTSQVMQRPKDLVRSYIQNQSKSAIGQAVQGVYSGLTGNAQGVNRAYGGFIQAGKRELPEFAKRYAEGFDVGSIQKAKVGGKVAKSIFKTIHPEDINLIDEFADYVRSGLAKTQPNPQLELGASDLAEKYIGTGKQPKDLSTLATRLQSLANKGESKPSSPLAQEVGKYKTAEEAYQNYGGIKDNYDWKYLDDMRKQKAAGKVYSNSDFNALSRLEKDLRGKESRTFYRAGGLDKSGNIWLTPQEHGAIQYGSSGGTRVREFKVGTKNPLILEDFKEYTSK